MEQIIRPRRLRGGETLRKMVRETRISKASLVYPMFVTEGENIKEEIASMPGQFRYSIERMGEKLGELERAGVTNVMFFGIPKRKDAYGSMAYAEDGIAQKAFAKAKQEFPNLYFIGDVCMCEYTSHGHCGILCGKEVDNDGTLSYLAKIAVSQAQAGADMVAPSDMMDGRIAAIRKGLDEAGFTQVPIMAYSAKFASAYYGPFREAAHSTPGFGDRRSYQMDCANGQEALREIGADIEEGADIVMVKPALAYLDVLREAALTFDMPLAVYNVSGEYAMVKAAAANGWIDERRVVMENLTAMKRAGARVIITYHALDAVRWIEYT